MPQKRDNVVNLSLTYIKLQKLHQMPNLILDSKAKKPNEGRKHFPPVFTK